MKDRERFSKIIDLDLSRSVILDLTNKNQELSQFDITNPEHFESYIRRKIAENKAQIAIGRYDENRVIYDHSNVFDGTQRRTVHLGIDLWTEPGTKVFSPLAGRVHSFRFNNNVGDYGPTMILEHETDGRFYTLYGHLSLDSLDGLHEGKKIEAGQEIARVGNYPTNGNWAPHLHFQLILDMKGMKGDFPGVASEKDREKMLKLCPDPNIILNLNHL
ncbi:peptidoglycan DD-metalloendopeptidase family protein [Candidatus Woesearchaeota archaeon]|nr:peptidoglycan DD-metalloendopeptidase family protein [Candidatus Woesearchaeota archaeon]